MAKNPETRKELIEGKSVYEMIIRPRPNDSKSESKFWYEYGKIQVTRSQSEWKNKFFPLQSSFSCLRSFKKINLISLSFWR